MSLIKHLNLVDLRLIINIAQSRSITRGAHSTNLSTASASKRVKNLETKLGVNLFVRTPSGITLTPAGKAYVHHAGLVQQQLERLSVDLQRYASGTEGHIRFHANSTAITEFLTSILPSFLKDHPETHIDLFERMSVEIPDAILSDVADIGIMAGRPTHDNIEVIPYRTDKLVSIVSPQHPLAQRRAVSFRQLLDYDHVCLPDAAALSGFLHSEAEKIGKSLKVRIQVTNCDSVCRMVEADAGVAVIPASAAQRHIRKSDISVVNLEDSWALRELYIVRRKNRQYSPIIQKLQKILLEDADLQNR